MTSRSRSASTPSRGEIWNLRFDPSEGAEITKIRPAVVISIPAIGRLPLRIVAPVTEWTGGVVRVVCNSRGGADLDWSIPSEVHKSHVHPCLKRHDNPDLNVRSRHFTTLAACQAVTHHRFPEAAPHRFGCVKHRIFPGRVAETTWSGNGGQRAST